MYMISSLFLMMMGIILFIIGLWFMMLDYILFMDWEIMSINSCSLMMTCLFDWMSLMFVSLVLLISSMVIMYSSSYMSEDLMRSRFLFIILAFIVSMLLMIVSPNMISILLGWDGLGLVSYALVIYFQNNKSYNAGMLTIMVNRVGDAAILVSIAWMFNFGGWNYLFYWGVWDFNMKCSVMLMVMASLTSSAQIPFSSWLPAAMAAPTPVSALVHSSTLVTAGVYLMIRYSYMLFNIDCTLMIFISVMTMFMSGLAASFEFDLSSIIALSTLSQLGLMMSILFMGFPVFSFFHLLIHAFFKALLFLCSGLIIHVMGDNQDIRYMGGILYNLPWTCGCFVISNMSLCGLPFMAGFYSSDLILESVSFFSSNFWLVVIFYISVGLTSMYTIRLMYYCLISGKGMFVCQVYYEDSLMMYSMLIMLFMSIVGGSVLSWLILFTPLLLVINFSTSMLSLCFILLGMMLSSEFYKISLGGNLIFLDLNKIVWFMSSMWFMPNFSTLMMSKWMFCVSSLYSYSVDWGWGEYLFSRFSFSIVSLISVKMINYHLNSFKLFLISFILIIPFFMF